MSQATEKSTVIYSKNAVEFWPVRTLTKVAHVHYNEGRGQMRQPRCRTAQRLTQTHGAKR